MAASQGAERFRARLATAGRRFNAWWEGWAYDEVAKTTQDTTVGAFEIDAEVAQSIWGEGRADPGDPAFTMRHARALGLATRAEIIVFGAGLGAPLRDLKSGTRWKATGFSRFPARVSGVRLKSYDAAMTRVSRHAADGALCLFELHRDADPAGFARVVAEHVKPGAPIAFVDYATARKAVRLASCFPEEAPGAPRCAADYAKALKEAGYLVGDVVDETRAFTPLIAKGWRDWRRAYEAARAAPDARQRALRLRFLAAYAQLWAERLEALRSGQLQVVRIQARKGA